MCDHLNEDIRQYFSVTLFITMHKAILTFMSVDEILTGDHSNESYFRTEQ